MSIFSSSRSVLHHFKICFPLPLEKVQNCLKKIQHLNNKNSSAVCVSFNGHSQSPESCQLFYESLLNARDINRLSVFTFLEDKATSLTYFTATAGQHITANPYSLIGDIGSVQKSYRNIKKLLDILEVKYEQLGSRHESSRIWNQFVEKSQREKELTHKWLELVENNMIESITERRGISKDNLGNIRSKVFHPRDALSLKLIDSIATFQDFVDVNFPNHSIENFVYKIDGVRVKHNITEREMSALANFFEVMEMPQVALLSATEPLQQAMREVLGIVQERLMSNEGVEDLDYWLGAMFQRLSGVQEEHRGLMFEL